MKHFKKILKSLLRIFLKANTMNTISRMCSDDGTLKNVGEAIKKTLQNNISTKEKSWIDKIELLREDLSSSAKQIEVNDFGANKPNRSYPISEKGIIENRTIGEVCKRASKPYFWSVLLFHLIREFNPQTCMELGTCLGISASYQAAALKLNGSGYLVTLEGSESLIYLANINFNYLDLDNVIVVGGRFQDTLEDTLKKQKPLNYVFIDGHHDKQATLIYFEQIFPYLSEVAILVFDDIRWSEGMKRAWETIITDERISASVNLKQIGICIIDNKIRNKKNLSIPVI